MPNNKVATDTRQRRVEDGSPTENDVASKSASGAKPKESDSKSGAAGERSPGHIGKIASSPPAGSKDGPSKASNGDANNRRAKSR